MKYVSIYVCIALLIASVFCTWTNDLKSDVRAGKGDGVNEIVETPEDFHHLIQFVDGISIRTASAEQDVTVLSADKSYIGVSWSDDEDDDDSYGDYDYDYDYDDDADDEEDRKETTYDSMTIHEEAYISASSSYNLSVNINDERQWTYTDADSTLNRSLTMYITKDERYYHSVGQFFSDTFNESDDGKKKTQEGKQCYLDFDVEIYVNQRKNQLLMKINKWSMLGGTTVVVSDDLIGKWASLRGMEEAEDVLSMVDGVNEDAFRSLRNIIGEAIDDGEFHGSNKTYTLEKKNEDSEGSDDVDDEENMTLTLNLSDPERPMVSMYIGCDHSSDESGQFMSNKTISSTYTDVTYTFENINNTVIDMSDDIDVIKLTSKNISRYIYVEK